MRKNRFNWHNLLMLACIIPMIAVFFYFTGGTLPEKVNGESFLFLAMALLCPLMHFLMMRGMNHGQSCDHEQGEKKGLNKAG
ncbi:hypothetical protein Tfer_0751 [Thermincola ferriacetica]|uniref:DUF2933 domain-containing protein n=1 Tax=Thermincola ferriacetica TaxID=281456 RepID=A0A0L6W4R1_9FIRM|nr:DUF2933 domain-containing protein [Thermincola ferriacetica]KNZ70567.1 hypothetical protein Tfer_0751 [Thermincola ferriacetica]